MILVAFVPELHPDNVDVVDGTPVTSVARTLVDMAGCSTQRELPVLFATAHLRGLLDIDAVRASRARGEWRPSLAMLDDMVAESAG